MNKQKILKPLHTYCESLIEEYDQISIERKTTLETLSNYISNKRKATLPIKIIVICTHNSRRSHIGQLWLQIAALWYGIEKVETFSGSTEATAFNHRSVEALRRVGFILDKNSEAQNPVYSLGSGMGFEKSKDLFSKKFDSEPNPTKDFAAIMVCTEADKGCPFVLGSDIRLSIPFEDPKHFDNTELENQKYDERVRQIGREFFYVMHVSAEWYSAKIKYNK